MTELLGEGSADVAGSTIIDVVGLGLEASSTSAIPEPKEGSGSLTIHGDNTTKDGDPVSSEVAVLRNVLAGKLITMAVIEENETGDSGPKIHGATNCDFVMVILGDRPL